MNDLYHHGIKGMKWGKRRYQNSDGSLTPAGIKRYAEKGYAEDSYKSNKTALGKAYDKVTGAHKIGGRVMYDLASDSQRKKRAQQYLKDQQKPKVQQKPKAQQKTQKKSEKPKVTNETRAKNIVTTRRIAMASKMASAALNQYGKTQYNKYKDDASPEKVAAVRGSAYASKALNAIGNLAVAANVVQGYQYGKHYWDKDS